MEYPHLERLSASEGRRLLPFAPVGRLVVSTPNFPTLEPVSFTLVEGEIVVAVRAGSVGDALPAGSPVAFEADVLDRSRHEGWNVVVHGRVEDLDADVTALARPRLSPWPPAVGDRLIRIRSTRLAGQRIVATPPLSVTGGEVTVPAFPDRPVIARRALGADAALALLRRSDQPVGRLA